jgi:hypothetical protein
MPSLRMVLAACGYRDVRITRPRTVGDLVDSARVYADERGWMARATSDRLIARMPMPALFAGAGLLAGPLRISSCLIVTARKPPAAP